MVLDLCRTYRILAAHIRRICFAYGMCATDRTDIRYHIGAAVLRSFVLQHRLDARDDFPRLIDENSITDTDVQTVNIVLIVQGRPLDARSAEPHGIEHGRRCDAPGPSDGKFNIAKYRLLLLRRILIGNRPTRRLCRHTKFLTHGKGVHLDHGSIDVIGQAAAPHTDLLDGGPDLLRRTANAVIRYRLDPLRLHECIRLGMRGKYAAVTALQIEYEHRQPALLRDARIQLPQCSCGTVARIGKRLQPKEFLPLIGLGKCGALHIDLAAHLKIWQCIMQLLCNIVDHACICCHVFSLHNAVTSCDRTCKHTVLVAKCQRQSVDLFLDDKFRRRKMRKNIINKRTNLPLGEYILQGEHWNIMRNEYADFALC